MVGVYVFEGVGMLFFVLGVIFVMVGKAKFKCTAETEGRIIDMCINAYDYNNSGSGHTAIGIYMGSSEPGMYCPIFTYRVNGMEYRRASNISWNQGQVHSCAVHFDHFHFKRMVWRKKGGKACAYMDSCHSFSGYFDSFCVPYGKRPAA